MKLYTFRFKGETLIGAEREGELVRLPFADMLTLIRAGKAGLAEAKATLAKPRAKTFPLKKVKLLAPLPRPGKMLFSGINYRSHLDEEPGAKLFDEPRFFSKLPTAVIGPNQPILHPGLHRNVDYEVELGVIIGRKMHHLPDEKTRAGVFGYTIVHDVSARAVQFKDNQETLGKNFDTFSPMGPCIVTADEIKDPDKLRLQMFVNGVSLQDMTNEDWVFPLSRVLGHLNSVMTLEAGDVVTTGTPAGVAAFRHPSPWLKPGDVCRLVIDRIGELVNPVVADPALSK